MVANRFQGSSSLPKTPFEKSFVSVFIDSRWLQYPSPNALWGSVFGPPKGLVSVGVCGSLTIYSQGIWKTRGKRQKKTRKATHLSCWWKPRGEFRCMIAFCCRKPEAARHAFAVLSENPQALEMESVTEQGGSYNTSDWYQPRWVWKRHRIRHETWLNGSFWEMQLFICLNFTGKTYKP